MSAVQLKRSRIRQAVGPTLVILGVWTIVAMVSATTAYLDYRDMGRPMEWFGTFLEQLPAWYMWALLTPFVVRLTRRHTIRRGDWLGPLAWHVMLSLIWMIVYTAFTVGYTLLAFGIPHIMIARVIGKILTFRFFIDYYIFWVIVAVAHTFEYYRLYVEKERTARRLESRHEALQRQLAESRLQFLRAQINPHFLFNTLNAVTTQIRKQENEAAIALLTGLSDLLRYALDSEGRALIPLGEELEFIEKFLHIQTTRFPRTLEYEIDVSEAAREVPVPGLILQPLVENALEYGAAGGRTPCRITIRGRIRGGSLGLDIDNTIPPESSGKEGRGIGLTNTRARLELVYGDDFRFRAERLSGDLFRARLLLPRTAPENGGGDD